MIQHVSRGGVVTSFLGSLEMVFATVPAVVAYDDDGPAPPVQVAYPFPAPGPGPPPTPGGPGLRGNPAPVSDGPDADDDVQLTLTFWRPQRKAVPAWRESGDWIDLGNLEYEVQVAESGGRCPQDAFSESDNEIELFAPGPQTFSPGFKDLVGDRPANTNNKFTYTLNLSRCLEANGFPFDGTTNAYAFSFLARSPNRPNQAQQGIFFRRN
jgi:hypothetical protein